MRPTTSPTRRAFCSWTDQPFALDFEVCNRSDAPVEFEFDLGRLTVTSCGNDPLGEKGADNALQENNVGAGGGYGCDVKVSPRRAVAPPTGSVRCTVREPRSS